MDTQAYQQLAQQQFDGLAKDYTQRAVLLLDDQGALLASAGQISAFGLHELMIGADVCELLPMLYPLKHVIGIEIPFVQLPSGVIADVAVNQHGKTICVALTAADREHQALQRQQQKTNELALLQREQSITLETLRHAHQQLGQQRDELDRLYSAQKHYLNKLSHEVRNPLQALLANLDGKQTLDTETTTRVQRGTLQLLTLVENLLVQGQGESSQQAAQGRAQVTSPVSLADDCIQLLQQTAQAKGLSLELQYQPGLESCELWLDDYRVRQILFNLIGNAIRYTQQGGIDVILELNSEQLDIHVKDSGPGISAEDQQSLFTAYQRGGDALSSGGHGAGLGLTISRELAEHMKGGLSLQSTVGEGSIFTLQLPALPVNQADHPCLETGISSFPTIAGRVLLVDDDLDWRLALTDWLQQWGLETSQCSSLSGIRKLMQQPAVMLDDSPDWLILDQHLPDGMGIELLDEVYQYWPNCWVILLSGESIELPGEYSQISVLRKPVTRQVLYQAFNGSKKH